MKWMVAVEKQECSELGWGASAHVLHTEGLDVVPWSVRSAHGYEMSEDGSTLSTATLEELPCCCCCFFGGMMAGLFLVR